MEQSPFATKGRFVVPEVVVSHFHIRPGDTVADYGAGSGYFIACLVKATGPTGRVYACEIQKNLVETIGNTARTSGYQNVDVLWSDLEAPGGSKLKDASIDVGILVNTLFQLEAKVAAVSEIARTIRPGGKLCVIDWSESFGGLGPQPGDVVTMDTARLLCEAHGFNYDSAFDAGDHHYGFIMKRT